MTTRCPRSTPAPAPRGEGRQRPRPGPLRPPAPPEGAGCPARPALPRIARRRTKPTCLRPRGATTVPIPLRHARSGRDRPREARSGTARAEVGREGRTWTPPAEALRIADPSGQAAGHAATWAPPPACARPPLTAPRRARPRPTPVFRRRPRLRLAPGGCERAGASGPAHGRCGAGVDGSALCLEPRGSPRAGAACAGAAGAVSGVVGVAGLRAGSLLRGRGAPGLRRLRARPLPSVPAERQEGYREGWHRRAASPPRWTACPQSARRGGPTRAERRPAPRSDRAGLSEDCPPWASRGEPARTPRAQLRGPLAPSEWTPRGRPARAGYQGRGHREWCHTSPLSALV